MPGLPEGWVTEVPGLNCRQQRESLGNGVVAAKGASGAAPSSHRVFEGLAGGVLRGGEAGEKRYERVRVGGHDQRDLRPRPGEYHV